MTRISELHGKWMKSRAYREAYGSMKDEVLLAEVRIASRGQADLIQKKVCPNGDRAGDPVT